MSNAREIEPGMRPDWAALIQRPGLFDSSARGGLTAWSDADGALVGDSLGPVMHSHDEATEIFYFLRGVCRLEVGEGEEILRAGDLILVPPDVPHNLWSIGSEPVVVFWLVAPNLQDNRWRTDQFRGQAGWGSHRATFHAGGELPSDERIVSVGHVLQPGDGVVGETTTPGGEVILITAGEVTWESGGGPSEAMGTGAWHRVESGGRWSVTSGGPHPAEVLVMRINAG